MHALQSISLDEHKTVPEQNIINKKEEFFPEIQTQNITFNSPKLFYTHTTILVSTTLQERLKRKKKKEKKSEGGGGGRLRNTGFDFRDTLYTLITERGVS